MPYATEVHISAHFSAWAAKLMASQQLADIVGLATQTLRASAWSFVRLQTIAIQCIDAHKEVQHDLSWRENMWLSCDHVTDGMLWCQYWTNQTDGSWRLYRGDKKMLMPWFLEQLFERSNLFNRWGVLFPWVQCKHRLNNYKNHEEEDGRTRR